MLVATRNLLMLKYLVNNNLGVMNRRYFLKNLGYGLLNITGINHYRTSCVYNASEKKDQFMNWTWLHANLKKTEKEVGS